MAKIKGKTSSGFDFAIDANVFKDWRFLKATRKASSDNPEVQLDGSLEIIALLFNDQAEEERFYNFLAEKNGGRVPADVVGIEAGEIMKAVREQSQAAKN